MRKYFLAACLAATALVSTSALAQQSCERQRSGRVAGTVAGATLGGVAGNVIAERGDKRLGTALGAVLGGVLGNQIAKPDNNCNHAYGYYDQSNRWHATGINSGSTTGYYNRDGEWVNGAPNGYYDDRNRWIAAAGSQSDNGYYGADGHWVPASANGYYDRNDQWIAGSTAGYYDNNGRWVAGTTTGHYDSSGRWVGGVATGRSDGNGNWVSEPQYGYYGTDNRWHSGQASGYYDTRGRWVATGAAPDPGAQPPRRDAASGYYDGQGRWIERPSDNGGNWAAMPREIRARETWLGHYIRRAGREDRLSRSETNQALRDLNDIRRSEQYMQRNRRGELSARNEAVINGRLDRLTRQVRIASNDRDRRY